MSRPQVIATRLTLAEARTIRVRPVEGPPSQRSPFHAGFLPDGRQATGRFPSEEQAQDRVDELLRRLSRRTRACITCGDAFPSEGAHHRMCNGCRLRSADDPYKLGEIAR
jgi:hypothetical protein